MTHVDDRGVGRSFGPGDSRAAHSRAHHARSQSRNQARSRAGDTHTDEVKRPVNQSRRATHGTVRKKPNRSHSAIGAAIVASAAMIATFAFILTNGNSSPPTSEGDLPPAAVPESSAPQSPAPEPSDNPAPAASTAKADRKPSSTQPTTDSLPNTGAQSPAFKRGQWIAVLDTYPADTGLEADQLAKELAGKLIKAGVPARAMLVDGQYPGIANSTQEPITGTWFVYLGPTASTEAALTVCQAPKTQRAYSSLACPTYEPATRG